MVVKQQQGSGDQLDLLDEVLKASLRHGATGEGGTGTGAYEERQATTAWEQNRALTQHMMEKVASSANLNQAYKRVKANGGAPGVDGMTVADLRPWIDDNRERLIVSLLDGSYRPRAVRGVEIPKPDGKGMRQLGIPTVVDRLVQQAILQILEPILDVTFSASSFGFRPGRGAHDALRQAREYVADGYIIVVDLDLEKFFDRVNHDILMSRLARRIGDKRLLGIIRRFLQAGMMTAGVAVERHEGTPQGGPLSPILANLLLDDLDKELERRGHRFCRYADDCNIYVRSQVSGERVMASVTAFLEGKLRLKVNQQKSAVAPVGERQFLGHRLHTGGPPRHCAEKPYPREGTPASDHTPQQGGLPGAGHRRGQRLRYRLGDVLPPCPVPVGAARPRWMAPSQVALHPAQALQTHQNHRRLPERERRSGMARLATGSLGKRMVATGPEPTGS
jgi:RNA-directed DNA polymerase